MKKLVLVNGAPGAGKDEVGKWFDTVLGYSQLKLTNPMDNFISDLIPSEYHFDTYRNDRNFKELKVFAGGTMSMRDVLIKLSEEFVKPVFGEDAFGVSCGRLLNLINRIDKNSEGVVITDCGFQKEVEAVVEESKLCKNDIALIRVLRDGCDFSNDSREFVDLTHLGIPLICLNNNGTLDELHQMCYNVTHYDPWFNPEVSGESRITPAYSCGLFRVYNCRDDFGNNETGSGVDSAGTTTPADSGFKSQQTSANNN